jgi:DNA-directed RNA polymerase subunit K/omega
MVQRPIAFNAFEFAVLAGLRAGQLARGCTPRVVHADKITVTAQMEVAEGKVVRALQDVAGAVNSGGDVATRTGATVWR